MAGDKIDHLQGFSARRPRSSHSEYAVDPDLGRRSNSTSSSPTRAAASLARLSPRLIVRVWNAEVNKRGRRAVISFTKLSAV